jgi:hypothetical protein
MEPVSLIVAALAAGAVKGIGETAATAVRDAYQRLKGLVSTRFAGTPSAEVALAEHSKNPEVWKAPLVAALTETGAAGDGQVIEAAQRLLALVDAAGSRAGRYIVDIHGAQGVQVGDHNRQFNQFDSPPQDS